MIDIESPAERAVFGVQLAVADLFIAICEAKTIEQAWQVHEMILPLVALLEVCERASLDKVEALNP